MTGGSGRIITFYSYKGGTGRTMAISNVAWVLASNGHKVLLIDWDLEAPGLHRYLRPFLIDRELASTPGLIDFVWDATRINMTPAEVDPEFPSLDDYVVGLDWSFPGDGIIDFIPAGRQDENYAQRVNTFNWDNFYERLGGGKLLEAQRQMLRDNYDYILIDSRTGVSDTSSICTVHLRSGDRCLGPGAARRRLQNISGSHAGRECGGREIRSRHHVCQTNLCALPASRSVQDGQDRYRTAVAVLERRRDALSPVLRIRGDTRRVQG
jgi:AAA domain